MNKGTDIHDNEINDVVLGDKISNHVRLTPLEKAIREIQKACESSPELIAIIDELNDYITDHPTREIIGVEKKLENGDRQDLIDDAVVLKNMFDRRISKQTMSLAEQKIYIHILAMINTTFSTRVRPLIMAQRSREDVDCVIHQEIILPIYEAVVSFDIGLTLDHVRGMLFFLTGKCRLVWSR